MIRLRLPALLAAALLLSACASTPGRPYDPFEASNRVMYAINDPLDKYIAKPIAQAWVDYVPSFIRTGACTRLGTWVVTVVMGRSNIWVAMINK